MNDPARWRSPGGDAPSEARELLRHASAPRAFDAAARARNAAAIAKISAGAATAPTLFGAKLMLKVGLAGLLAITAGATLQRVRAHREGPAARGAAVVVAAPTASAAPVAPVRETERGARPTIPAVVAERAAHVAALVERPTEAAQVAPVEAPHVVATQPPMAPIPTVAVVAPARPRAVASAVGAGHVAAPPSAAVAGASGYVGPHGVPALAAPAEPLQREADLIDSAVRSLNADPSASLAALDRHAREFPAGQMAVEREFLAVRALRSLGRDADARARAAALANRYPASPYAARARHLFEATP
jgi:hypothetical protein